MYETMFRELRVSSAVLLQASMTCESYAEVMPGKTYDTCVADRNQDCHIYSILLGMFAGMYNADDGMLGALHV